MSEDAEFFPNGVRRPSDAEMAEARLITLRWLAEQGVEAVSK